MQLTTRVAAGISAIAAITLLAACLNADLVACDDLVCPAGNVCTPTGCAVPADIAACDGIGDGESCQTGAGGVGVCEAGVCRSGLCGNAKVDVGERCDGELGVDQGQRCSDTCTEIWECGNGIVDPDEMCDDGDTNPADGCDMCMRTSWTVSALVGGNTTAAATTLVESATIALDRSGNIYIADAYRHQILRLDASGALTTVAGTASPNGGYNGDGDAATSATLLYPEATTVDGLGNLYIADAFNTRIRRVDTNGIIATIAGTGTFGLSGDGGAATSAMITRPSSVAVDGLGTLYFGDSDNHRVRRVDAAGVITTFAGTIDGDSGDGGLAINAKLHDPRDVALDSMGRVLIVDTPSHRVRRIDQAGVITTIAGVGIPGYSGDGGPAAAAELSSPAAIAADQLGNVYIADFGNYRIRRIDAAGIITTIAGTGAAGLAGDGGPALNAQLAPQSIQVDAAGNLFVFDQRRIRRIDTAGVIDSLLGDAVVGAVGDGGSSTSVTLQYPAGITVDAVGNLYVVDTGDQRVRRIDRAGVITTVAGNGEYAFSGDGGPANAASLAAPYAVAVDAAGNVYIADGDNHRIRKVDANGVITTYAGNGIDGDGGDGGPAIDAELGDPVGLAIDANGVLYVSQIARIRKIDPGGIITTYAGTGVAGFTGDGGPATNAELEYVYGMTTDSGGNLFLADIGTQRVRKVDANGVITTVAGTGTAGFSGDGGPAVNAELVNPNGVGVDASGNFYIADSDNERIRRVDANGIITTWAGSGVPDWTGDGGQAVDAAMLFPNAIAFDAAGAAYIATPDDYHVRRVAPSGVITTIAGRVDPDGMGPLGHARFADPRALVVTPSLTFVAGGRSGTVQAARTATSWLEIVAGRYPQPAVAGALARFRGPDVGTISGVAFDAANGKLYVTESSSHAIQLITIADPADETTWTIAPLANTAGVAGYADGAVASSRFREPTGLWFDAASHQLYVADTGNHVIRSIDLSTGQASATVHTVAGNPATRGFFGDGSGATAALLFAPQAITRCANGDLFIADTGNHRVRRVEAATSTITTVLGVGVAASSGEGAPASTFPVNAPLALACDPYGNLFVTSTSAVRLLAADANGVVDGTGDVQTIYGAPPRETFPASVTRCLSGLAVVDATTVQVVDSCTGILVGLHRTP